MMDIYHQTILHAIYTFVLLWFMYEQRKIECCLYWLFFLVSPLRLGYEARDWYEMVSKLKLRL